MELNYISCLFLSSPLLQSQFQPLGVQTHSTLRCYLNLRCKLQSSSESKETSQSPKQMFVLGMGFVGQFFGEQLKREGWDVCGTCTSDDKKKKLEGMGFDVELFDAKDPKCRSLMSLEHATHLLISIPTIVGLGDPVLYQHRDVLGERLSYGNLQWLGYLSSTSVYGDCGGAWVDEDYHVDPTSETAKTRLVAEKGWLSLGHDLGVSVQVFRLGGIYGPGRSALSTLIKQGSLTESQTKRESRQYVSRVHVADICQALKASIDIPSSGRIYNIVDDEPAPRAEVFDYARCLVEKKWPGLIKSSSSTSRSMIQQKTKGGEKRVLNARIKNELGVRLLHPTYRSGLDNILMFTKNPFQ
ncbi:hypothetical protein GIB67_004835 [Kingdonia uniflora]|uniref:NAD-dependent epimerase/dehydratase domain-containing protein n=1 Tax=Kingdonia uniflora TaxID=39325 RepID=A0A7J7LNN6_9MAGN|nr:hypothetical protein GIB67_004835 [Kingdonia uniflora]